MTSHAFEFCVQLLANLKPCPYELPLIQAWKEGRGVPPSTRLPIGAAKLIAQSTDHDYAPKAPVARYRLEAAQPSRSSGERPKEARRVEAGRHERPTPEACRQ